MDEQRLRAHLRDADVPDAAAAQLRARALVTRAHADRPRRRPSGLLTARLAIAAAFVLTVVAVTAVRGPSAVAHWVGKTLRITAAKPVHATPVSITNLPGGGRLLVTAGTQTWLVGDGHTQRVPGVSGSVTWSAFGRYLAFAQDRQLSAADLTGRVVWTERFAAPVSAPSWSPDGNRIAFRVGAKLHVTAGNGTVSHAVRRAHASRPVDARSVMPAWRPGAAHVVAVVDRPTRITVVNTDTGAPIWRVHAPARTFALSWSADGRRLLAVGRGQTRLFGPSGQLLWQWSAAHGTSYRAGVISPSGRQIALLRSDGHSHDTAELRTTHSPARVLTSALDLGDLTFSPDGRWLLVGWHRADSWLFFATAAADRRVRQITHVAGRLNSGQPVVEGWCCARPRG